MRAEQATLFVTTVLEEPRLIVQRFQPFARFTPALISEVMRSRERITRKGPCAVMVVIPPEIPVNAMESNDDHLRNESQKRSLIAMAVVASNAEMNAANKFYFRYYPQSFEVKVFSEENEARSWLRKEIERSLR